MRTFYFISQGLSTLPRNSLLLRRFVFRMAEASAKRVTGDEPQGAMGARFLLPAFLCAHIFIKRETSGYEAGLGISLWHPEIHFSNGDKNQPPPPAKKKKSLGFPTKPKQHSGDPRTSFVSSIT